MLYRYRLFLEDGSEAGEADYAVPIQPGETIWTDDGRRLRVLDVMPTAKNPSDYFRLLKVATTEPRHLTARVIEHG